MGVKILAEKGDGRDGSGTNNLIYCMCIDIIAKGYDFT